MGKEEQRILRQKNRTKLKYSGTTFMIIHCITHLYRICIFLSRTGTQKERFKRPMKAKVVCERMSLVVIADKMGV